MEPRDGAEVVRLVHWLPLLLDLTICSCTVGQHLGSRGRRNKGARSDPDRPRAACANDSVSEPNYKNEMFAVTQKYRLDHNGTKYHKRKNS